MPDLSKLFLLFIVIALYGCASVTPPTGGPKDEDAPELLTVVPANKSLNYKGRTIALEFNEEVELRDLQKELIITPYTTNTYETKVKKNSITLEFKDPLQDNTTYTFNFRGGIRDLTEGNAAVIPPITFSTGTYLDSGQVSGQAVRHLTDIPEASADILLYRATDTGTVKTAKPYYVTRTDANGQFSFTNLAIGPYNIYALTDKNNTLTYDQDTEWIGYKTDSIYIGPEPDTIYLRTVRFDTKNPFVLKRAIKADRADLEYNEGLTNIQILNQPQSADSVTVTLNETGKIARVYRLPEQKEVNFIAQATDSAGFKSIDTIAINYTLPYKAIKPSLQLESKSAYLPTDLLVINSSVPIGTIKENAFSVLIGSTKNIPIQTSQLRLVDNGQKIVLPPLNLPKGTKEITINSDSTAVITITNLSVPALSHPLSLAEDANIGSVKGRITTSYQSFILQLLDNNYKVIQERKNEKLFTFKNLEPGEYRLRVLIDNNSNGIWEKGTPDLRTSPESVYNHPETLEIRANWELEDVLINVKNSVDNR